MKTQKPRKLSPIELSEEDMRRLEKWRHAQEIPTKAEAAKRVFLAGLSAVERAAL